MQKIDISEMKKIEVDILDVIFNICNKNHIKLYLGGGTLLGAIRHNGFIPWDDDIDVMMLRDDYNKLLSLFNDKVIDNVKILTYDNTSDYYYPFAKAVNVNTFMDEKIMKSISSMGVYVDIFPVDKIPNNENTIKKIFLKRKFYQKILNFLSTKDVISLSENKIKKFLKMIILPFTKIISTNFIAKKLDTLLIKYNNKELSNVTCISGVYMEKEIMPKEYIADSVEVQFEGKKYFAPIGYDSYLTKHYGKNYMQIPPKEKQISNHDNVAYWK